MVIATPNMFPIFLERDNIKGLIFDVDNTIATMGKGITERYSAGYFTALYALVSRRKD